MFHEEFAAKTTQGSELNPHSNMLAEINREVCRSRLDIRQVAFHNSAMPFVERFAAECP